LAVLIVVLLFFGALIVNTLYNLGLEPRITLSDATYQKSGCGLLGLYYYWTYNWTFNLTNSGNAKGLATLTFSVNGTAVSAASYLVPAGAVVNETTSVDGPNHPDHTCPSNESASLAIDVVTKA